MKLKFYNWDLDRDDLKSPEWRIDREACLYFNNRSNLRFMFNYTKSGLLCSFRAKLKDPFGVDNKHNTTIIAFSLGNKLLGISHPGPGCINADEVIASQKAEKERGLLSFYVGRKITKMFNKNGENGPK